jgi:hypothetical protein
MARPSPRWVRANIFHDVTEIDAYRIAVVVGMLTLRLKPCLNATPI